jgi:hypothetical protein
MARAAKRIAGADTQFPVSAPAARATSESSVTQTANGRKDQTKGMLALHIDVRARNWLNVVTNLEGINQSDFIERLIFKEMGTYNLQEKVAQLMR